MGYKLFITLILAGFVVLFIIQNVAVVEVRFLIWTLQISKSLLIFLLFAIGMIMGWALNGFLVFRQRRAGNAEKQIPPPSEAD